MNNTIILKKGYAELTKKEYKSFEKGSTIWGADRSPEEIKRWDIDEKEQAELELAKYRCTYSDGIIEEYALEYCECNEDGDFLQGSDYELAAE